MFNELDGLDEFFTRVQRVVGEITQNFEVVCVNDGSTDATLEHLARLHADDPRIVVINLARNFGKDSALSAGLDYCRGQIVIPIDADLQDPPELIPEMIEKWEEGYDVVYATRRTRRGESLIKIILANAFYRILNRLTDVRIPIDTGDFRLMDRVVVEAFREMPERTRFLKGIFAWVGFPAASILYDRDTRFQGTSKWNYIKLWRFALDGLTSFSSIPVKVWSLFGMIVSFLSFIFMAVLLIRSGFYDLEIEGYTLLAVVVLFFSGVQLISIGMLGEYVSRIFDEVKARPLYVVRDVLGVPKRRGKLQR